MAGDTTEPSEVYRSAAGRLGRGTAVSWLAWIAARALTLVTLVLLTQTLPAADLGALLTALAAGVLGATLATGGLPDATTRNAVTEAEGGFGRGDINRALLRFAVTWPAILVLVLAVLSGREGEFDWSLLAAAGLLAITQGGTTIVASVFRARGEAGRYAVATNLAASAGRAGVALAALVLDAGAGFVLWTFVLLNVGVIAGAWQVAVSKLPRTASASLSTGSLHVGGAVWNLLQNLDVVVVGLLVGVSAAGTYGVALRLAEFSLLILVTVSVIYLPEAAKLAHANSREELVQLYRASSRWCALISLPIAGTGFAIAPDLAELLLPEHASAATTVLRILFPAYALQGTLGLSYPTAVALGADRIIRRTGLVAIPGLVIVTVTFTGVWGMEGAAVATLLAFVALTAWWLAQARELLGALPFDRMFARAMASCLLSCLSAGLVAAATAGESPLASVVLSSLAALVTWIVVVWVAGALSAPELRALTRLSQRGVRLSTAGR